MATRDRSFRFEDGDLQGCLLALVRGSGVPHAVDADGTLRYASADVDVIENDLICAIRNRVFPGWSVFTLEGDATPHPRATAQYREYMTRHAIPFVEEVADGFIWFLLPNGQDSHAWAIPYCAEAEPGAAPDPST
jgi:hypothetical protein